MRSGGFGPGPVRQDRAGREHRPAGRGEEGGLGEADRQVSSGHRLGVACAVRAQELACLAGLLAAELGAPRLLRDAEGAERVGEVVERTPVDLKDNPAIDDTMASVTGAAGLQGAAIE